MVDGDLAFARYVLARPADEGPPAPGAEVYRRIVRANLVSVIGNAVPVARSLLGEAGFEAITADFLAAGGPATSFYREIPGDFVAWAAERGHPLADLIHWEWLELLAARHPAELDGLSAPAPGLLAPNPTIQIGVYNRPVHLLDEDTREVEPFEDPMALLVWRRPHTDETAHHAVGLLVARALALATQREVPPSIDALAAELAAEVPELTEDAVRDALHEAAAALRARDGLLG